MLQNDQRFKDVQEKDRELLFMEYSVYIQEKIIQEFTQFLENNPLITKDSPLEDPGFKELVNKLNLDIRCERMSKHPDKRDKLIRSKIRGLKYAFEKKEREQKKLMSKQKFSYNKNN
jgi:hypothetical protein